MRRRVLGRREQVTVQVGRPTPGPTGMDWICPYEIHFGNRCVSMALHGSDSMQALQLAIATLDAELNSGAHELGGTLFHFEEPFTTMLEYSGLEVRKPR